MNDDCFVINKLRVKKKNLENKLVVFENLLKREKHLNEQLLKKLKVFNSENQIKLGKLKNLGKQKSLKKVF